MPELVFPEILIRNVVEASLERLLVNDRILALAVSELTQEEQDTIRTMLQMRPGKVRLGWSDDAFDDWIITVVLASTTKKASLGEVASHLKESVIDVAMLTGAVDAEPGSILPAGRPADAPLRGLVRIEDEVAAYHEQAGVLRLVSRGLRGVADGRQTVAAAHPAGVIAAFFGLSQDLGWHEDDHLRLDVVSSSALLTIVLGRLLPIWFCLDWRFFEARGITLEEATESDLAPRAFFVPNKFYARTLMVRCTTKVALPEDLVPLTAVDLTVTPLVPTSTEVPSA